ncbi:MAG TPA: Trk system potassium transporter TrkA [Pseudomonadales bacterium]|jgi:trk system potassium uptake protein TrkA
MKILILGAGQVGGTLALNLASEKNDITVVDTDSGRLQELQSRLDIRTVVGSASHPSTLRKAGADDADMLIAVTSSDEINMVACQVAHSLFRTPTKICRVRAQAYIHRADELFRPEHIPVDVTIAPEQLVTRAVERLLEHPGALQVMDFADGRVQLVGVKAFHGGPLVSNPIRELRNHTPDVDMRVAAIYRQGKSIIPDGDTAIQVGDEVFFIAAKEHIQTIMGELGRLDEPYRRIMIAGGGNIGARLAATIEKRLQVKLIEFSHERCQFLSDELDRTIVLQGSASDHDLLRNENIEDIDVFCALTNDDEINIMSSLLAKRLGARKVITLITNPVYVDLIQGGEIDIALSPQQITIGSLLTHIRRGDAVNVHSLRRGAAEALEIVAHGEKKNSRIVGRRLEDIKLPEGVAIAALVRGEKVIMAHHDVVVETDDHVIVFLTDKQYIKDVEKLFHVGFHFF